jgi:hypothetical protein
MKYMGDLRGFDDDRFHIIEIEKIDDYLIVTYRDSSYISKKVVYKK